MRTITSFAISALALASVASADVDASAYFGAHSQYIYRGVDLGADETLTDFGLDFSGSCDCGLDWYAGIWYASTDTTDELDIFFGATKDLGFGTVDFGYINYTYPDSNTTNDSEIYLGLSTSYRGFDLGFTTSFGLDGALDNVTWFEATLGYTFDVYGYALGLEAATSYQAGANGVQDFAYSSITASTDISISEDLTFSPYLSYIVNSSDYRDSISGTPGAEGDEFIGGASLSFAF